MDLLNKLKNYKEEQIPKSNIIKIPFDQLRFICENHIGPNSKKLRVAITMNPNDLEFQCDCGITYIRTKDLNE